MLSKWKKELMSEIRDSMKKDVLNQVRKTQINKARTVVYGVYDEPLAYKRRKGVGGLIDQDNIVGETDLKGNTVKLSVYNITKFNSSNLLWGMYSHSGILGDYLTPLIVLGHFEHQRAGGSGYTYFDTFKYRTNGYNGQEYAQPRDFISLTEHELYWRKGHVRALEKSLESKGFNVQ